MTFTEKIIYAIICISYLVKEDEMKEVGFILKLFEAAYMQRWNDRLRPMEFYELDKQAHKMMIAYFIASFEDDSESLFVDMLKGGLFEFLQRIVITDIKPPVFYMIQMEKEKYIELNRYIVSEIGDFLDLFGNETSKQFMGYFDKEDNSLSRRILAAAHTYSSIWEYDVIRSLNPNSYDNVEIENDLKNKYNKYIDLKGVKAIEHNEDHKRFIHLCGALRYQSRWSHLHRIPKTSVLGHSLFVAWVSYYFSYSSGNCKKRIYNDFVGALFHDLPETLTRDIISPIKRRVEGLLELITEYEIEQMNKIVYPMLPEKVAKEIVRFLSDDFSNTIIVDEKDVEIKNADIDVKNNYDEYSPYDGEMIKACDDLAAYIEAASAISNGCVSKEFEKAKQFILDKYTRRGKINGIDFSYLLERLNDNI